MERRAPDRDARAMDADNYSADLDATFFAERPSCRSRVRTYVLHEFWPLDRHTDETIYDEMVAKRQHLLVRVTRLGNELRAREPLFDLVSLNTLGAQRN
jgi:hypothetical protein